MTNEQKRAFYRSKNIDVEIQPTMVVEQGKFKRSGKYRFMVNFWTEEGAEKERIYSDPEFYDSYEDAENKALEILEKRIPLQ